MNKTKIEWCLNPDGSPGYTWNPITGCLNHTPEGLCLGGMFPCYAYKLANGRLKSRYLANRNVAPRKIITRILPRYDPFYPRFWEDRLRDPIKVALPWFKQKEAKGIFVCDMSDLFGIGVPENWTYEIMQIIKQAEFMGLKHRFYLLTKQPQNLIKFSPFPDNCWVGITVTKPEFLLPALDALDSIQCSVRYLSIEPMLAAFDVPDLSLLLEGSVDWLILGSQTKPYKPPTISDVEEIVRACDKAGVPVFLKDNLRLLIPFTEANSWLFESISGIPTGLKLRQEMPR